MSRRYDDPVEVRRRDDEPAEFLWRGRFYAVREVLARWVETGAWWQAAVRPGTATGGSAPAVDTVGEREGGRVQADRQPRDGGRCEAPGVLLTPGALALL